MPGMSDMTTPSRATETGAASNAGGEDRGFRKPMYRDKEGAMGTPGGEPRFRGRRRRKVSYLTINKIDTVDYKEVNILRRFLNDRGKILPSRQTGNTAKQQRMIAQAIRRAREMALLPFVVTEFTADRPPRPRYGDRPDRGDRYGDRTDRGERAPAAGAPPAPESETEE
jgi:small subunit ribosomal protein S18